jgi:hypothetical protein
MFPKRRIATWWLARGDPRSAVTDEQDHTHVLLDFPKQTSINVGFSGAIPHACTL